MKLTLVFLTLILLFNLSCNKISNPNEKLKPVGYGYKNPNALASAKGEVGNFSLLDQNGDFHELYRHGDAKAIVIISQGNDCPIIQKYSKIINDIKNKYTSKNVVFYMLNPSKADTRESIQNEVKEYGYELPILMDSSQVISESLGITRTSEVVIIDPKGWKIIYRGAISDRLDYGADKQEARNNYLDDFLNAFINNLEFKSNTVPAKGCLISFDEPKSLSYEKVIAPIFISKCLNCHSETGGYLPVLNSYSKIKNWASMSKETIFTDRMPPFSADTHIDQYKNDISLSPDEKRLLVKWYDAGAPNDSKIDPMIKAVEQLKSKLIQKKAEYKNPIYTVTMKPLKIPPGGEIEYKYVQLGDAAPFDMWIDGGWTTSTNPRQLHHASAMITSKPLSFYEELTQKRFTINQKERESNVDGDVFLYVLNTINIYERKNAENSYLRFMVWGSGKPQPFTFKRRKGVVFIPKGSYIILETHYMGTGKEENEQTTVNFYGSRTKPKDLKQLYSYTLFNPKMEIPPMVKNFEVVTPDWEVPKNILLNNFLGHLHMRGKAVKVELTTPSGETKTIVSIPNYYYGWQTGSGLEPIEPIAVKKGSKLRAKCYFDNSPQNPFNPDPSKKVKWGQRVDRTEMCKMNMNYILE
jgi:hypothetical protein